MPAFNIAVYLSGGGSNFRAIHHNSLTGELSSSVRLVIAGSAEAGGLLYAEQHQVPCAVLKRADFSSGAEFAAAQLELLAEHQIDLIVLAGYMKKLSLPVIRKYKNRILNIHPALLPAFGGKGMYGHFVHEAVIAARAAKSGATVHFVDEIYDHGKILLQQEVEVLQEDTPESLQKKVLAVEHIIYSRAIRQLEKAGINE